MLPFLIALRFDCGPAAEWQHFGAVVLAVPRMPETLSVATSRLFVLVNERLVGRPSLHASATGVLLPLVCLLR